MTAKIPPIDGWRTGYSITSREHKNKDEELKKDFEATFEQTLVITSCDEYPDYSWYSTEVYTNGLLRDIMWEFITGWHYWCLSTGLRQDFVDNFKQSLPERLKGQPTCTS